MLNDIELSTYIKELTPEIIEKARFSFIIAILVVVDNYFGITNLNIPQIWLTVAHLYLLVNGTAAASIIYRKYKINPSNDFCPQCKGALEVQYKYQCPNCGKLKFGGKV